MKLPAVFITALTLVSSGLAVEIKKQVIISYASDAPDSVLQQAKQAIIDAGGVITHEYDIIKGFAATVGEKTLATIQSMSEQYRANIEEDQVLSITG